MHIEFFFSYVTGKIPDDSVFPSSGLSQVNHRHENREKSTLDVGAYSSKARGQSEILNTPRIF